VLDAGGAPPVVSPAFGSAMFGAHARCPGAQFAHTADPSKAARLPQRNGRVEPPRSPHGDVGGRSLGDEPGNPGRQPFRLAGLHRGAHGGGSASWSSTARAAGVRLCTVAEFCPCRSGPTEQVPWLAAVAQVCAVGAVGSPAGNPATDTVMGLAAARRRAAAAVLPQLLTPSQPRPPARRALMICTDPARRSRLALQ
jgi:hypothetical protein